MGINIKLDTKEKFKVLTPQLEHITATMTEEIEELLQEQSKTDNPHLIIDLREVLNIDQAIAISLAQMQQNFYENSLSFVICEMQPAVVKVFEAEDLFDSLNFTPTLSEAWDMVQMEAIERELMEGFD